MKQTRQPQTGGDKWRYTSKFYCEWVKKDENYPLDWLESDRIKTVSCSHETNTPTANGKRCMAVNSSFSRYFGKGLYDADISVKAKSVSVATPVTRATKAASGGFPSTKA